jgi:hypothetical protein
LAGFAGGVGEGVGMKNFERLRSDMQRRGSGLGRLVTILFWAQLAAQLAMLAGAVWFAVWLFDYGPTRLLGEAIEGISRHWEAGKR